ncbi:hypothetical protein FB451DRAFT_1393829 [Mycena latifolia]|nr:hypothetical protein FB451DRAFT_1393829 [Mycena latifolia]
MGYVQAAFLADLWPMHGKTSYFIVDIYIRVPRRNADLWEAARSAPNVILAGPEQLRSADSETARRVADFYNCVCGPGVAEVHLLNTWGPNPSYRYFCAHPPPSPVLLSPPRSPPASPRIILASPSPLRDAPRVPARSYLPTPRIFPLSLSFPPHILPSFSSSPPFPPSRATRGGCASLNCAVQKAGMALLGVGRFFDSFFIFNFLLFADTDYTDSRDAADTPQPSSPHALLLPPERMECAPMGKSQRATKIPRSAENEALHKENARLTTEKRNLRNSLLTAVAQATEQLATFLFGAAPSRAGENSTPGAGNTSPNFVDYSLMTVHFSDSAGRHAQNSRMALAAAPARPTKDPRVRISRGAATLQATTPTGPLLHDGEVAQVALRHRVPVSQLVRLVQI